MRNCRFVLNVVVIASVVRSRELGVAEVGRGGAAAIAGGLYLGLRASLDTEFVLEIDGQQFVAFESQVPNGLALRGTYWWPTDGVLSSSAGSTLDVSLSAATDALPERSEAPPGAWFTGVPATHDRSSQFTLQLNFDEADPQVTGGSMADALTITGGSLVTTSEAATDGKTWELTVAPDGPGDVTVTLPAATDCATDLAVCTADGRMLHNTSQATIPARIGQSASTGFTKLSGHAAHTCALRADATIACWGDDSLDQADAPSGTFTDIVAGDDHSCAVADDGTVACWGMTAPGRATRRRAPSRP